MGKIILELADFAGTRACRSELHWPEMIRQ